MKTQSVLKVFKSGDYEYIYIYFKLGVNMLRINSGNKYVKSYMNADLTFTRKMPDYEELNGKTTALKMKVDAYINRKLQYAKPVVSQKECMLWLQGKYDEPNTLAINLKVNKNKTVLDFYSDFYTYKQKQLNHQPSTVDYKALQTALTSYQSFKSTVLKFQDLDSVEFLVDFRNYLSDNHAIEDFKGGLNDNTIYKRFINLKTFFKYLEEKELYTFKHSTFDFKLSKYENEIITLSKDEIKQIMNIKTDNAAHQRVIDLFIFNCFTGLRFSDLKTLKASDFIIDAEGDYFLIKENKKTGIESVICVQSTALAILKKYDFQLPVMCCFYFDDTLHAILKKYELFEETLTKKRRNLKVNNDYSVMKRDCISSHTCRRTFITLSINANVPLNAIMKASGHRNLSTLQKYAKKEMDKAAFKAIDF